MKKLKALGLVGIVLVIALMSVSSVWAGPLKGTIVPPGPAPRKIPGCATVGTPIDEEDLPEGAIAGKRVQIDEEDAPVTVCIQVPSEYVPYLHKLVVRVPVGGGWITIPSTGSDNIQGEFYRIFQVALSGSYYLFMP